ncbi:hypothetical protein N0V85_001484 [Neurospora sp. IMI 360204]|nr:hypothetical protein N0V85_001484 [Neurospora sp. IMI 360204]
MKLITGVVLALVSVAMAYPTAVDNNALRFMKLPLPTGNEAKERKGNERYIRSPMFTGQGYWGEDSIEKRHGVPEIVRERL